MWMIAKLAPEGRLSASFLRSARRALQRLVETEWLITAGNGGPGDPLHYSIHPMRIDARFEYPLFETFVQNFVGYV